MREACKFNVRIHNGNILMSSVTKDPGVSSILLFIGSGINFPRPLYIFYSAPGKGILGSVGFLMSSCLDPSHNPISSRQLHLRYRGKNEYERAKIASHTGRGSGEGGLDPTKMTVKKRRASPFTTSTTGTTTQFIIQKLYNFQIFLNIF